MSNDLDRAKDALLYLDAGCSREDWIKAGMGAKAAGLSFVDFHGWSQGADNYAGEKECQAVWKSISETGGVTPATLFKMAFDQGWTDTKGKLNGSRPYQHKAAQEKTSHRPAVQATSQNAAEVWGRCIAATPAEAYIYRKKGKPDGLRIYPANASPLVIRGQNVAGYLAVPCWSGEYLQTLQFIPPDGGDKLNLPGASFNDGFFTVGEIADRVYICEGIGQAWAVHQATGAAAAVCFGAGRMMAVAKALRDKFPAAHLVIVPDRGKENQAADIAAAVAGAWVEMPDDKPGNYDANDYLQESGAVALSALLERVKGPPMRFKLLSGADLYNAPQMRWMVRGVLPVEGLAALYGASGSGKSFLTLDIAAAVAGGDYEWFGRRVSQAPVTYVCLEGEAGMGKRVKAWSLRQNKPVPDGLRFITQAFDLLSDDVPELAKAVMAGGGAGGLVILDTLNRAAPGADENSSVDMGNLIAAAKQLQSLTGGLVLLVHHTGKDATKGLRGHSSLYAALDGAIEVVKTDSRREWTVAKSKDDITGEAHPFVLEVVPVGTDDDGEEITSCVVQPVDDIDNAMRRIFPPKSGNQKIIWEALQDAFIKHGTFGKSSAPLGRPCLTLEDAIDKTCDRLLCEPKRQKERTQSALTGLVTRGLLEHREGWLWIV